MSEKRTRPAGVGYTIRIGVTNNKQDRMWMRCPTLCAAALGRKFTNPTLRAQEAVLEALQVWLKRSNQMHYIKNILAKEAMVYISMDRHRSMARGTACANIATGRERYLHALIAGKECVVTAAALEASVSAHS